MRRSSVPVGRVAVMAGMAALASLVAGPVGAQTDEGIRIVSEALEIGIGGRVQTQFNTTTVSEVPESQLILRRARLELDVRVNRLVSGTIQPDFAGDRVSLKDVYLQFDPTPGLHLRTGKFHRPFSLLETTSSTRILPIERGALIRGAAALDGYRLVSGLGYSDRDIGVQVGGEPEGAPLGLTYAAGVFQGPFHQARDRATYQYVARATVSPAADLTLGAAWSNRAFVRGEEAVEVERGDAFEVDVEYGSFSPGFHLLAEVAVGDVDPFAGEEFLGAQAWLAYRTRPLAGLSAVEPILRVSHGDVDVPVLDDRGVGGTLLTPGVNLYLGGRNRVMLNYDLWLGAGDAGDEGSLKAMFQLAF